VVCRACHPRSSLWRVLPSVDLLTGEEGNCDRLVSVFCRCCASTPILLEAVDPFVLVENHTVVVREAMEKPETKSGYRRSSKLVDCVYFVSTSMSAMTSSRWQILDIWAAYWHRMSELFEALLIHDISTTLRHICCPLVVAGHQRTHLAGVYVCRGLAIGSALCTWLALLRDGVCFLMAAMSPHVDSQHPTIWHMTSSSIPRSST